MINFDILKIMSMHNFSSSDIPSNISSLSNNQILNEITNLRVKLTFDEYEEARELYKKLIKSINIAFIKLLYAQQYYTSVHNNPLLDYEHLFNKYYNKSIENPFLYKLLREHIFKTNLIKFIILTHFCNKSDNNKSDKNISDKIIDIYKELLGLTGGGEVTNELGFSGGGEELTEAQKKLLVTTLVFSALAIDNEKTRNSFKLLIEKVNISNSKEIIEQIDKIVADSSILPTQRFNYTFSIMNLSSDFNFQKKDEVKKIIDELAEKKRNEEIIKQHAQEEVNKIKDKYQTLENEHKITQQEIEKKNKRK